MKPTFIALLAFSLCLPLVGADKKSLTKAESAKVIEKAIRKSINKPTGELTKANLERVKILYLGYNQLTEVPKGLEKLTQIKELNLKYNPALTKAQIATLQRALPNCKIFSNPTK